MRSKQAILAAVGGGCLGLLVGGVLGAIVGGSLAVVEPWEDRELYGFLGLAHRVRGVAIGAIVGAAILGLTGAWFGARPDSNHGAKIPLE